MQLDSGESPPRLAAGQGGARATARRAPHLERANQEVAFLAGSGSSELARASAEPLGFPPVLQQHIDALFIEPRPFPGQTPPVAMDQGTPPVSWIEALWKVPSPLPNSTETLPMVLWLGSLPELATPMSIVPSPSMNASSKNESGCCFQTLVRVSLKTS